jgi:hypothetical protein
MTAVKRVLVIGGYGNFGSFIVRDLAAEKDLRLIVAGRTPADARRFVESLPPTNRPGIHDLDINRNLQASLEALKPDIVIHTSGPYQDQGYGVAEAGASSVPCLTSAIIDHYREDFAKVTGIDYAIATAQQTNRGLATTSAVLSYAGKSFETLINGRMQNVYGWQGLQFRKFEGLGYRALGNCDVPDLELFPAIYPELQTIRFHAGLEVQVTHIGLWVLTWFVRCGLIRSLATASPYLLKMARWFDRFGSDNSGFFMKLSGKDENGRPRFIRFDLTAKKGDGPFIPCMPAILMAKGLAQDRIEKRGAFPCIGFIDLESYLRALQPFNISWSTKYSTCGITASPPGQPACGPRRIGIRR